MGYCMTQDETYFYLPKENFTKALKAIEDLVGKETIHDSSGSHFAWIDNDFAKREYDIEEMLEEWRWAPIFNSDGHIVDLEFTGDKLGDDEILFKAIAPFVHQGCFITMHGEDGALWRWRFEDNVCHTDYGEVVWT